MAPQTNNTITTNNILGDYMLWYFLDADTDNDTQYYYIVNNSTGNTYVMAVVQLTTIHQEVLRWLRKLQPMMRGVNSTSS